MMNCQCPSVSVARLVTECEMMVIDPCLQVMADGSVSSFFRNLSYSSFQQLADRYVQEEIPSHLPQQTTAPELVRFAFTLDFTARMAGLSNQAVCRIMGFGNQYLEDRFTQLSRTTSGVGGRGWVSGDGV